MSDEKSVETAIDPSQVRYTNRQEMFKDLLKAQTEIEMVKKDEKNPFYKSDYASLSASIEACKKALNKNNLIVLQPIESDEGGVYVCTTIIHVNGEAISSKMKITTARENDPQAQGSALTYARRYSLKSLLTMADSDDDAETAMPPRKVNPPSNPDPDGDPDWIKNPRASVSPGACAVCGAVGRYHKKGCPNAEL
jgi:hypothetical protein